MPKKIPVGWVETTLGEITEPSRVRAWPSEMPDLPFIGLEHIEPHTMKLLGSKKASSIKSTSLRFSKGDVLYGKMGPKLNKVWLAKFDGLCSPEFFVFPKTEGLNSQFFAYRLNSRDFVDFATQHISGDRSRVDFEKLAKFPFLLPSNSEQERIVAKLNASLANEAEGEARVHSAQGYNEEYRASTLRDAVTGELTRDWRQAHKSVETGDQLLDRLLDERRIRWEEAEPKYVHTAGKLSKCGKSKKQYPEPAEIDTSGLSRLPIGWVWVGLQQLGFITGGLTKNPRRASLHPKLPYLRVSNVYADELRLADVKTIGVEKEEIDKLLLEKGDLLIVEGNGSKDQIGRLAIWDGSIEKCVHQNHLIKVRLVDKELGRWILYWLLSPLGRHHVEKVASSTTGLYTLSTGKIASLPIPLPPPVERAAIVREVELRLAATDQLAKELQLQLDQARIARQSLLHKAFTGNLAEQNSNDEPASMLLERIRAIREAETIASRLAKKSRPKTTSLKSNNTPVMNQSVLTTDDLQKAWLQIGKKTDAKTLFEATGFTPDQVSDFYGLLRTESDIMEAFRGVSNVPKPVAPYQRIIEEEIGRFRLMSVWLEDFKNLKDYTVNFDTTHGVDIVLGWNGTGKSNFFEALLIIFRDLHYWLEKNRWTDEPMDGYCLRYEIEDQLIEVKWDPKQMKRPEISRAEIPMQPDTEPTFSPMKRKDLLLPRFVFGYYSGPTNRLAEHFLPMKRDHYNRLRQEQSDDPKTLAQLLEQRRFFCAETHHAKYVLLAFSYKKDPKIWDFLEKRLRIEGFESALFVIRKPRWAKDKSDDFWGATGIMRRVMEKLKRYAVAPMVLKQKVSDGYRLQTEELYYFFLPDINSLHEFAAEYADARSFFLALESTDFSELIYDVKIQVRVKATNDQAISVTFRELSEGEQQLLMVLGLMRFTKSHQSLVLLDEPDTHLNPHWSVEYLKDLASVISDNDKPSPEQQTSQILMATHDPLVIASLLKDQVHLLKRDPETLSCYWQQASVHPRGLGFTGILTSEMFGFRSDLDTETLADIDNRVRLIAKEDQLSASDKKEIEEIDKRLAEAGFSKAFSDPYYAAFVRAWGKRYAEQMAGKQSLTPKEQEEIDRIAREVLAEAVAEVEKEARANALR